MPSKTHSVACSLQLHRANRCLVIGRSRQGCGSGMLAMVQMVQQSSRSGLVCCGAPCNALTGKLRTE